MQMKTMVLPSLQHLLEAPLSEEYPYERTLAEAKNDPAFVLHTSGSTGQSIQPVLYASLIYVRNTKASDLHQPIHLSGC